MSFFLYHRTTSPTGRLLARALGIPYGHLGPGQTPRRERSVLLSLSRSQVVIRWGSQQVLPSESRPGSTLNSETALGIASDKLRTLQLLEEQNISTVPFVSAHPETTRITELFSKSGTVLGRSRHGARGSDIRIFHEGDPLEGCEFYTAYIPNSREYRIHVFQGEVIRTQGKYLDFPEQHKVEYIKNHGQGFRFRTPDVRLNTDRYEAATGAVAALGLDFGAVDLLIGLDKKCYVLEVNTAPACAPMTARAYVRRFAEWLGQDPDLASQRLSAAPEPVSGQNRHEGRAPYSRDGWPIASVR